MTPHCLQVKRKFKHDKKVYNSFLDIMKDFQSRRWQPSLVAVPVVICSTQLNIQRPDLFSAVIIGTLGQCTVATVSVGSVHCFDCGCVE